MKEILAAYERLLLFRLQAEPPVDEEELRGLLADWYQLKMLSDWSRLKRAREEQERRDPPPAGREDSGEKILRCAQEDSGTAQEDRKADPDGRKKKRGSQAVKPGRAPAEPAEASFRGPGAKLKRDCLEKLEAVRRAGVSLAYLEKMGGGSFTLAQLTQMLNRERVPIEVWEALSDTLAALEKPEEQEPSLRTG